MSNLVDAILPNYHRNVNLRVGCLLKIHLNNNLFLQIEMMEAQ
jgi:hypothetical protein